MQEKVNGSCVDSKEKGEGKGHTLETVRNNVEHFIQRRAIKACVCVYVCVWDHLRERVWLCLSDCIFLACLFCFWSLTTNVALYGHEERAMGSCILQVYICLSSVDSL